MEARLEHQEALRQHVESKLDETIAYQVQLHRHLDDQHKCQLQMSQQQEMQLRFNQQRDERQQFEQYQLQEALQEQRRMTVEVASNLATQQEQMVTRLTEQVAAQQLRMQEQMVDLFAKLSARSSRRSSHRTSSANTKYSTPHRLSSVSEKLKVLQHSDTKQNSPTSGKSLVSTDDQMKIHPSVSDDAASLDFEQSSAPTPVTASPGFHDDEFQDYTPEEELQQSKQLPMVSDVVGIQNPSGYQNLPLPADVPQDSPVVLVSQHVPERSDGLHTREVEGESTVLSLAAIRQKEFGSILQQIPEDGVYHPYVDGFYQNQPYSQVSMGDELLHQSIVANVQRDSRDPAHNVSLSEPLIASQFPHQLPFPDSSGLHKKELPDESCTFVPPSVPISGMVPLRSLDTPNLEQTQEPLEVFEARPRLGNMRPDHSMYPMPSADGSHRSGNEESVMKLADNTVQSSSRQAAENMPSIKVSGLRRSVTCDVQPSRAPIGSASKSAEENMQSVRIQPMERLIHLRRSEGNTLQPSNVITGMQKASERSLQQVQSSGQETSRQRKNEEIPQLLLTTDVRKKDVHTGKPVVNPPVYRPAPLQQQLLSAEMPQDNRQKIGSIPRCRDTPGYADLSWDHMGLQGMSHQKGPKVTSQNFVNQRVKMDPEPLLTYISPKTAASVKLSEDCAPSRNWRPPETSVSHVPFDDGPPTVRRTQVHHQVPVAPGRQNDTRYFTPTGHPANVYPQTPVSEDNRPEYLPQSSRSQVASSTGGSQMQHPAYKQAYMNQPREISSYHANVNPVTFHKGSTGVHDVGSDNYSVGCVVSESGPDPALNQSFPHPEHRPRYVPSREGRSTIHNYSGGSVLSDTGFDPAPNQSFPQAEYRPRDVPQREGRLPVRNHPDPRRRSPTAKLPQFNGTVGKWERFEFQFQNIVNMYRWDDQQKLEHLKSCLIDHAIDFVSTLPPHILDSYPRMISSLRRRFRGTERPEILRKDLHDMKQRMDESVDEFADRILKVISLAFQGADQHFADLLGTEHFIRGVRDRNAAYETAKVNPETVQEALIAMKNASALMKSVYGRSQAFRQVTFMDEPKPIRHASSPTRLPTPRSPTRGVTVSTQCSPPQMSPRRFRNSASSPRNSPQRSPNWRPKHDKCFHCMEPGHFKANCPHLKESPKGSGQQ
jgi:hypothetical protein